MLVRPGVYTIVAGKPGYSNSTQCEIEVWPGDVVTLPDFSLNALEADSEPTYATLTIRIDPQDDGDVADMEDVAISIRTAPACDDEVMVEVAADRITADGETVFLLPAGQYQIVAWHPESQSPISDQNVELEAGLDVPIDIVLPTSGE